MPAPVENSEKKARARGKAARPREVVYFTSAVGLLDDPLYGLALKEVRRLHPGAKVLSARALWSSAKDWIETYQEVLADVTRVCILPYAGGVVGVGIAEEVDYLNQRVSGAPSVYVFDEALKLRRLGASFILPNPTKGRFMRLCTSGEGLRLLAKSKSKVSQ